MRRSEKEGGRSWSGDFSGPRIEISMKVRDSRVTRVIFSLGPDFPFTTPGRIRNNNGEKYDSSTHSLC